MHLSNTCSARSGNVLINILIGVFGTVSNLKYLENLFFHNFRSDNRKEEAIRDNSSTGDELGSLLVKISNLQVR